MKPIFFQRKCGLLAQLLGTYGLYGIHIFILGFEKFASQV